MTTPADATGASPDEGGPLAGVSRSVRLQFWLAGSLGPLVVRLLGRTVRWRILVDPETRALLDAGTPHIWAFWHGQILPLTYTHRGRGAQVMVSHNKDGELITRVIEGLGFGTVRGSSSRGGAAALRGLLTQLRRGRSVAITPDGPRGPRHEVQDGVVAVAARGGAPVIPLGVHLVHAWRLDSWDRFEIMKPFGRAVVTFDPPLTVPRDATDDLARWREIIGERLARANRRAEEEARGGR